jgi:ElaB/YqjD/DUF883 family membrane-anchored ribosome-binding protein
MLRDITATRTLAGSVLLTKAEKAELKKLPPEALIEGFVYEAKLNDPAMLTTVAEMNEHGTRSRAYAAEIVARGGAQSLAQLLDSSDKWLAYSAANALADLAETKDQALSTLDRLAEERSGNASASAQTTRNMVRYGTPWGPSTTTSGQH